METETGPLTKAQAIGFKARKSFRYFFETFRRKPITYGRHTYAMIDAIDGAVRDVERGTSRYLAINVPRRHGKSECSSRMAPPWILCNHPEWEIILAAHSFGLASDFSIDARSVFRTAGPYYGLSVSEDRDQIGAWRTNEGGGLFATGIQSANVGRGANCLLADDWYESAADAESSLVRERVWRSLTVDLLGTLAPVHLVILICNRWNVDDPIGRIQRLNDSKSKDFDPHFPKFEPIKFQAQDECGAWLFPERYPESWYLAERSMMGSYAWAAQFQQEPRAREGGLLKADRAKIVDAFPEEVAKALAFRRGWDLASTEAQRTGPDPDYSAGIKAAFHEGAIYIADIQRGRWEAPERDRRIVETAAGDGSGVHVKIEAVGGYKDTMTRIREILWGKARVEGVTWDRDKVARVSVLEPAFEAGKVFLLRGEWNRAFLDEVAEFPHGRHDDQVDALGVAVYSDLVKRTGSMSFSM